MIGGTIDLDAGAPFGGELGTDLGAQRSVADEDNGPAFETVFGLVVGELGEDMAEFFQESRLVLGSVGHGDAFGLIQVDAGFLTRWCEFETGEVVESVGGAVGVGAGVEVEGATDEDGGLLLPDRLEAIGDLKRAMSEFEAPVCAIDGSPQGSVGGGIAGWGSWVWGQKLKELIPWGRQGGDGVQVGEVGLELAAIVGFDQVAVIGITGVLEQLVGEVDF